MKCRIGRRRITLVIVLACMMLAPMPLLLSCAPSNENLTELRQQAMSYEGKVSFAGHSFIATKNDGTAIAIGPDEEAITEVETWTNLKQVTCGGQARYTGLKEDGTVVQAGDVTADESTIWQDILCIEGCYSTTFGITKDHGMVVAGKNESVYEGDVNAWTDVDKVFVDKTIGGFMVYGINSDGDILVPDNYAIDDTSVSKSNLESMRNAVQLAPFSDCVAVRHDDGTVEVNSLNVKEFDISPAQEWSNIVDLKAGQYHVVALREDGKVLAVGEDSKDFEAVSDWSGIVQIAATDEYTFGLSSSGDVLVTYDSLVLDGKRTKTLFTDCVAVFAEDGYVVAIKKDGSLVGSSPFDFSNEDSLF